MFSTGFTSLSVLLLFSLLITFFSFVHSFDSISSNIDEVLSINPSANVFVFGDFNIHHKDWLTYSSGTDQPGELCYNFSISNDLTQMVDLFLSSDASICSTMAFPPFGNSDHVVASVSIDFPTNLQQDAPFHCIAYDYSWADWDGLHDNLRDVPWEDIFKLGASAAPSEFCEWVQVGIDLYKPHRKYQVKSHLHGFELLVLLPSFIEIIFFVCTKEKNF